MGRVRPRLRRLIPGRHNVVVFFLGMSDETVSAKHVSFGSLAASHTLRFTVRGQLAPQLTGNAVEIHAAALDEPEP